MLHRILRSLCLAVPGLLVACGSIPTRTFQFDAIDVEEKPLPCVVVVNDKWEDAARAQHFVNVGKGKTLALTLTFDHPEVEVTVAPVALNPDTGVVEHVPRDRTDKSDYIAEPRTLTMDDPKKQLFILQHR
jgi:hypothetical protein